MSQLLIHLSPYLVSLAILIALFISCLQRNKSYRLKQKAGLQWLSLLKRILSTIQQHRGMTTGYLNGSVELSDQIHSLQKKLNFDIEAIASEKSWFSDNERWQGISQHWHNLSKNFKSHDSTNNLKQHNLLIQNILYLIDDMAEEHHLLDLKTDKQIPLQIAWREMLVAAEHIGQARALGMAIASTHHCDTTARIRMKYLMQKIEQTTRNAWQQVSCSDEQHRTVQNLQQCIQEKIMVNNPAINVNDYFTVATRALDSVHAQYDELVSSCHVL